MKRLIIRVLGAAGLVPARRYEEISRRVRDITRDRDDWKKRASKGARRERALVQHARDLEKQLKKQLRRQAAQPTIESRTAPYDRASGLASMQARLAEAATMQARLLETERALALARDHLNAIEVKLEILEGAANVLDARTRVAPQHRPDETGAAVS